MQQLRLFFAMALLYMFRVTIPPIIRSTYVISDHLQLNTTYNDKTTTILTKLQHKYTCLPEAYVLLMMGGIVTRNMQSKAIAKNKRNCCILLDLFHYQTFRVCMTYHRTIVAAWMLMTAICLKKFGINNSVTASANKRETYFVNNSTVRLVLYCGETRNVQ